MGLKNRNPPTSRKQMRKLGEPQRKIFKLDEKKEEGRPNPEAEKSAVRPLLEADRPATRTTGDLMGEKNKKQKTKMRKKEEKRTKMEIKAKVRKEKKILRKRKRKEREDQLKKKGERRTKNQPKILKWMTTEDRRRGKTQKGGRKGIG